MLLLFWSFQNGTFQQGTTGTYRLICYLQLPWLLLNFSGLAQQDNGGTNTEKQTGFPNQIFIIFQTKFYINMENADRKGFSLAPERAES